MSFDQTTRNRLQRFVTDAKNLLVEECTRQLQNEFGIDPGTGEISDVERLTHLDSQKRETANVLRDIIEHYRASSASGKLIEAIERIVREQAFTILNRLCALRMAEAREIIIESIGSGHTSKGFQLYHRLAGTALGETGDAYRCYILSLYDELSFDMPSFFDRFSPMGRLFPRESALLDLIELMDHDDIVHLWSEDETIGWIYQYFNSQEERRQMRAESQAPRNSRELAVRNQFFTPRYVVEFLTDNTLGRTWYEMTQGKTSLVEQCRYLVRRPTEIFLQEGEEAPEQTEHDEDLSQEELLKQPVYIPYRKLKDPREILMLDPACGSMHFGLYAFDLYETIYREAWEMEPPSPPGRGAGGEGSTSNLTPLHNLYSSKEDFIRDIPRLIIEHNIHGIDIDPRAVQIAGLSLWLRAQRSWNEQKVKSAERPAINKTNVVCAEPMPGEESLLKEFTSKLKPTVLGQLVEVIFEKMELAGEAGSLLKIEEELTDVIASAKKEWQKQFTQEKDKEGQLSFMTQAEIDKASGKDYQPQFDFSDMDDDSFWNEAEERILNALQEYAESAEGVEAGQKRLFAGDAARGFGFIDLCRKRYDVVLMNPPFGECSTKSKKYFFEKYLNSSNDIFQAFVDIGIVKLLSYGLIGVISARTGFFLGNSKNWRSEIVFKNNVSCFVDLGLGVLDDALVEVAIYVIEKKKHYSDHIYTNRQLDQRNKGDRLFNAIQSTKEGGNNGLSIFKQSLLKLIPNQTFSYWAPESLIKRYNLIDSFFSKVGKVKQGIATADDFRFVRLCWEVDILNIGKLKTWVRFSKGGEYSPPYDDIHLLVDWFNNGEQLKAFPGCYVRNESSYYKQGVTYTVRTASAFAGKILPKDCIFSHNAQTWFNESREVLLLSIGYMTSRVAQAYIELSVGSGDITTSGSAARRYTTAVVESIPSSVIDEINNINNINAIERLYSFRIYEFQFDETTCHFSCYYTSSTKRMISQSYAHCLKMHINHIVETLNQSGLLDKSVSDNFSLSVTELQFIDKEIGVHPTTYTNNANKDEVIRLFNLSEDKLISNAIDKHGSKRWFTKKSYFVDRQFEIICHYLEASPESVQKSLENHINSTGLVNFTISLLSELFGITFGRWDIRYATSEKQPPPLPDPFDPLPVCPPGMLQNDEGLSAEPKDVPDSYPLRISWDGILVDDEGHKEDILLRVRETMEVIWKDKAGDIEEEACDILGIDTLREYFSKPNKFFADHLKRYSKSRRQAPIYWPLSTASGSYTLWLYYHRLNDQILYTCVNDYVEPKLKQVTADSTALRKKNKRTNAEERELERLTNMELELKDFRDELLRIAKFWKPNLNDGVQITASPLWSLFRLPAWQKKLRETWQKLERGDYDWAHLAYSIWPDRVKKKCVTDKSLAIAHGLEELYKEPVKKTKKKGKGKKIKVEEVEDNGDDDAVDVQGELL